MQSKQNNKDISAVILSVILHAILFGLLILGSLYHRVEIMGGGEGDSEVMGAVMVDTGAAAQEWGRLQQQKKGQTDKAKKTEPVIEEKPVQLDEQEIIRQQEIEKQKALEKQKEIEQQKEIERQKQLAEQKKQEEQARLAALEKQKQAEEAKAKQLAEAAKLKAEAEAKRLAALAKQAEEEAKAKAAEEAKRKAEKAKAEAEAKAKVEKAKAEAEAKVKAEKAKAEAKAKAEKAKADAEAAQRKANQAALDDFFSGGDVGGGSATRGSNTDRQGSQGSGAALGAGDGGKTGDQYAGVIKREIQRRFLKEPSFANKVCVVEVEFLRDGTIANYRRVSGPDDICQAAVSAVARTKKVPPAPTDDIYQRYKKSPIEFKLR
ncbi:TPA: cell envelope integrity protein TolA [Pasteurella multocida]|uniref:cell envelope integrity protein TolA n=1 Tax=Pasteurella multocida TaxID=747 RepID=UPI0012EA04B8|nr:cell envelope integrity protein TolA [Pasteurella multocida]MEB3469535.1 cell envelope integrity protein TolA [Pasteurella multocida]NNH92376.1 cell envelope integrity protein TolA [Pasteurella multocida]QGV28271.1 cell envelope integrity protein TolA [Pasteurella multocida]HDR0632938.1 cell envelope integrity protein TolA [Pasteurella multocida]HDR0670745.1 cell envelope integrity protein TolA [Pasteurella multocida]